MPRTLYSHPIAELELADWRRRVADLYAEVRSMADPEAGWHYWRQVRRNLFQGHPMSPVPIADRAGFSDIPHYAYDPALRFAVDLEAIENADSVEVPIGADGTLHRRPFARTVGLLEALGNELTIFWIDGYGGGLFLPFKDLTSGTETFGGGRYLLDAIKSADLGQSDDGRLILDFNFAYHPSCAWNAEYVCPLAPPENALPVAIRAGERMVAS